jgi:DNA-binding transcriptional LysR family regulator
MFYGNLRALDETARAGSIRKASATLGVAPSSISRNIAILEREMGTALLERRADGVELTHAGRLVAEYARSVLLDYDSLKADLDDMRGTQRRLLKLALVESVASHGPINAVTRLVDRFRAISFNIRLMPAPRVVESVLQGRCDIGIAFCAEPDSEILTLASVPEPIVFVVRPDHPLASVAKVSLHEISDLPLAVPDFDFGVRQILERSTAAAGIRLTPVLTCNDFEILRGFVRCGAGAAVLPMRAVTRDEQAGLLKAIPLTDSAFRDATIDIIVLRKRRLPRVVKAFADVLIAEIKLSA